MSIRLETFSAAPTTAPPQITCSEPWISVKKPEPLGSERLFETHHRRIWRVPVCLAPNWEGGESTIRATLEVTVDENSGLEETFTVPVQAIRSFGVSAPLCIHFGAVPLSQSRQRRIRVSSFDQSEFHISNMYCDDDRVLISGSKKKQREHFLSVSVNARHLEAVKTIIRLETTLREQPVVTIPVRCLIVRNAL